MSDARDPLRRWLLEHSYFEGDFLLSSGARSTFYIDVKRTSYDARGRQLLGSAIADWIEEQTIVPDCVGGLTLGADAIAHAVGSALLERGGGVREASVRKTAKDHGRMRLIEGNFTRGDRVLVLDDVVTSGESTIKAIEAFRAEGGEVLAALAIVDRRQGGAENIGALGVRFAALFTIDELRGAASPAR
jgi:orotate phosphoribosyltransferase